MADESIHAVLLAAGRSSRMGKLKQLLPWGDSTVIETCVGSLLEGGVDNVVVVVSPDSDAIRARLAQCTVKFAVNEVRGSEMSTSIERGVAAIPQGVGAIMIALCDQPAIPPLVVRLLIETWRERRADVVQPEWNGRGGHPILIDKTHKASLENLNPEAGLRAFLANLRATSLRVPVDSPYVTMDMDTWEDYVQMHTLRFGVGPGQALA